MKLIGSALLALAVVNGAPSTEVVVGSISGHVYDENGKPFSDVDLMIDGASPTSTYRARATTDDAGYYKATALKPGEYAIYPYRDHYFYPLPHNTFYTLHPDRITITAGEPNVHKDIHMEPPAGVINASIMDQQTGSRLESFQIILCRSSEVDRSIQLVNGNNSGGITYEVPSDTPISILVKSPGHKEVQVAGISVGPRQSKEVQIQVPSLSSQSPTGAHSLIEGERCEFGVRH